MISKAAGFTCPTSCQRNFAKCHLSDEDEDHEEEGCDGSGDAAVLETLILGVTLLPQRVLHYPVPVVSCSSGEQFGWKLMYINIFTIFGEGA